MVVHASEARTTKRMTSVSGNLEYTRLSQNAQGSQAHRHMPSAPAACGGRGRQSREIQPASATQ